MHQLFYLRIPKVERALEEVKFHHPQKRFGKPGWAVLFGLVRFEQLHEALPGMSWLMNAKESRRCVAFDF
jgi:hypothetical protein